ncbi:hypothetical protein BDY19DRAFT_998870 [Irpex rosettiformis]|uniref:Uncharacterized protein n=1 Tax=Irpex rosettiformis TaxID=378272 RepID=A0ACB8TM23_9APHY|nr:hypothetical protein BDY19DRAFT_998870 [Irpex rosettiformis]
MPPTTQRDKLKKRADSRPKTLNVFFDISTGIYTSPNAEYLPLPPLPTDHLVSLFDGLKPRWAYDDYFYLAVVPVQVQYDLPMLDCLSPPAMKLRSVRTETGIAYRMDENLCRRWVMLEYVVILLQRRLLARTPGTYLLTVAPPYPSSFGYAQDWPSEQQATLATRLARTAFTLRFAFISFLVMKEMIRKRSTWQELAEDIKDPVPLSICNTIRASWVCDFEVPRIGAFVDVDGSRLPDGGRQWHEDIVDMINAGIPLWFGYSHKPVLHEDASQITRIEYDRHMPDKRLYDILKTITEKAHSVDNAMHIETQRLVNGEFFADLSFSTVYGYLNQVYLASEPPSQVFVRRRRGNTSRYEIKLIDGKPYHRLVDETAKPHQQFHSDLLFFRYRQRPGDTYLTFVDREKHAAYHLTKTETSSDKERRKLREAANRFQPVPSARGPRVFVWVSEYGMQFRKQVRTGLIRNLWERTTPLQRFYNPFRDEYDIDDTADNFIDDCVDNDPSWENVSLPPSDDEDTRRLTESSASRARSASPVPRPPRNVRPCSPLLRNQQLLDKVSQDRSGPFKTKLFFVDETKVGGMVPKSGFANLASRLIDDSTWNEEVVEVNTESIQEILRKRYGYMTPDAPWSPQEEEAKKWLASNDLSKLYRALGHWKRSDNLTGANDTLQDLASIADFVAALKANRQPPPAISDLNSDSARVSAKPMYESLVTQVYQDTFTLPTNKIIVKGWYLLRSMQGTSLDTSSSCKILTNSATNVLHLKRGDFGATADDILLGMVTRGMTVRLLLPVEFAINNTTAQISTVGERPTGVGIKPHGVKLNLDDYQAYARLRDAKLSGPAGKAALLEGGIIWRLALNICNLEDALRGPDLEDSSDDNALSTIVYGGQKYAETTLNEQDKFVIVGVYRVLLSGTKNEKEASISSWWPSSEIWEDSGYGMGYWSHGAEEWYQRRLKLIESGEASPLPSNGWRNSLRYTKSDSREVLQRIETLSVKKL